MGNTLELETPITISRRAEPSLPSRMYASLKNKIATLKCSPEQYATMRSIILRGPTDEDIANERNRRIGEVQVIDPNTPHELVADISGKMRQKSEIYINNIEREEIANDLKTDTKEKWDKINGPWVTLLREYNQTGKVTGVLPLQPHIKHNQLPEDGESYVSVGYIR